jgi:hypothetical protein
MILAPDTTGYPTDDERFEAIPTDMTLEQCLSWTSDFPPSPIMNSASESYTDFVKRQTSYAAYRNDVIAQRDRLKRQLNQLTIPPVPVGDDIAAAINWIQTTGKTPLEYLTTVYRDTGQQTGHRISAASKLMEYIHRRMPQAVDAATATVSVKSFDPASIRALSEKELVALEKLLEKMK